LKKTKGQNNSITLEEDYFSTFDTTATYKKMYSMKLKGGQSQSIFRSQA